MPLFWIVGMVVSGLAVVVFSDPGLAVGLAFVTLGLALVVAFPLMNLWMPLVLLFPVMVFHAAGRTFLGIVFAAVLALAAVMLDAFLIDQSRARLIPEQGPELTAFATPPRSIEIVARDWTDLRAPSDGAHTVCGPTCAALLTGGGIDWLRVRLEGQRGGVPTASIRIEAAPVAECAARLPGYDPTAPCLLFRQDDGTQADLVVQVAITGPSRDVSARLRPLGAQRTVIADTRPSGGVVHDRTDGAWDVALSPFVLVPNAEIHGGDWAIRRVTGKHTLTTAPALGVLARAGIARRSDREVPCRDGGK